MAGDAADRNGLAEIILCGPVGGRQLGDLGPTRTRILEDVGRARIRAMVVVVVRPDDSKIAVDRHTTTEVIRRRAIAGQQLGNLVGLPRTDRVNGHAQGGARGRLVAPPRRRRGPCRHGRRPAGATACSCFRHHNR